MQKTIINLITSPDKLFNNNPSLLLVNPSDALKEDFNKCANNFSNPINLYLFESEHKDLGWLIDISNTVDHIVIDIDNTKEDQWIIGYLLGLSKTFYLTNEVVSVYNSINVNRIYQITQFMEGVNYFGIPTKE